MMNDESRIMTGIGARHFFRRTALAAAVVAGGVVASPVLLAEDGQAEPAQDAQPEPERKGPVQPPVIENPPPIILPPPATPRGEAFNESAETVSPLSPAEIRQFKAMLEAKQDAMYGGSNPDTLSKMFQVSLDTGASIPTVKIAPGYVSSIVFVDSYGNPWPIEGVPAVGNPNLYSVVVPETSKRNVITISSKTAAGSTNLSVVLEGEGLPVNIRLTTDRQQTHVRADMQVEGVGPNTNPIDNSGRDQASTPDDTMMAFVDGVPPEGAVPVQTSDIGVRAWKYGDLLYLRTKRTVLSPSWLGVSHGTAGLRVYRMQPTPMVLYSESGQTKTLRVSLDQIASARK